MLLKAGADVNVKSSVGETALDWALKYNQPGRARRPARGRRKTSAAVTRDRSPMPPRPGAICAARRRRAWRSCRAVEHGVLQAERLRRLPPSEPHRDGRAIGPLAAVSTWTRLPTGGMAQCDPVRLGPRSARGMMQRLDPPGGLEMVGFSLFGLAAAGHQPDAVSDAMVFDVASNAAVATAVGPCLAESSRAPISDSNSQPRDRDGTAVPAAFGMPGRKAEFDSRIDRARAWLRKPRPQTNEDYAMRSDGPAVWSKADPAARSKRAGTATAGRGSGRMGAGAQNVNSLSDAYATGQALWALRTGWTAQAGRAAPPAKPASFLTARGLPTAPGTCAAGRPNSNRISRAASPTTTISGSPHPPQLGPPWRCRARWRRSPQRCDNRLPGRQGYKLAGACMGRAFTRCAHYFHYSLSFGPEIHEAVSFVQPFERDLPPAGHARRHDAGVLGPQSGLGREKPCGALVSSCLHGPRPGYCRRHEDSLRRTGSRQTRPQPPHHPYGEADDRGHRL